jgi:hypothetical protein
VAEEEEEEGAEEEEEEEGPPLALLPVAPPRPLPRASFLRSFPGLRGLVPAVLPPPLK